jgi:gliding motility-associated-like protein
MRFGPIHALIFCSLLFCKHATANIFIVTSNADSGAGTLREAFRNAAANGTSVKDSIFFNLPDISRTGRTIKLDSSLPNITSHILIDGTTQNGIPFGISDARVQIENSITYNGFVCFTAVNVTGVEIYGLYLKGNIGQSSFAMMFTSLSNMSFGAPGKGNMITGFYMAFYSDLYNNTDSTSDNISFQSNLMGIDEFGDTATGYTTNSTNFYIKNIRNLAIGGLGNKEGNILCSGNSTLELTYTKPENGGFLKIEGNKIGTDRTGLKKLSGVYTTDLNINGYNDGSDIQEGTTDVNVEVTNNICSGRFFFVKIKNYFKIRGNRIGVGADNSTILNNAYQLSLEFSFCGKGIIGGPAAADKNYIAYTNGYGVDEFHSGNITISRNSFFCNSLAGIGFQTWSYYLRPKPFVTINTVNANTVSGTALPKSVVELFYDDACPGCEGKTYITTTTADENGNWQYNGAFSGGIVATATDTLGATSEFSTGTINTDSVIIKNATCGRNNGSVTKAKVVSGTNWYWEDELGNVIGHDTDLVNVGTGKYKFVASIGGNSCKAETILFEVKNVAKPIMDSVLIKITQPSCGIFNGALKSDGLFNDSVSYRWLSKSNAVLCSDFAATNPFNNLNAGDYYLSIRLKEDSTCLNKYGPFKLVNQSGPSLNTDLMQISNATCNKLNGAITHIGYKNTTGNIFIAWQDSDGKVIGNNIDLINVKAGRYQLKFKDGGGCDTIVTPFFNIVDSGIIVLDTSSMRIDPSACTTATGSITGVNQTGAEQIQWINTASNVVTGSNLNLLNVAAGTYQLVLNNHFTCSASVGAVTIMQTGFIPIAVNNSIVHDASCYSSNGDILPTQFSRDTVAYHFTWKDSSSNSIGNYTSLVDINQGHYSLYATDSNGCSSKIFTAVIVQNGKPVFDYQALKIVPDTCNAQVGQISGLAVTGGSNPYTWQWVDNTNTPFSTTPFATNHLATKSYMVTVYDRNNCSVISKQLVVDNIDQQLAPPVVSDQFIPRNTTTTILVNKPSRGTYDLLSDSLANSLVIASSDVGIFLTPVINTDRSFYIRNNYGDCSSALAKVTIKVFDSTILFVPSAFTPNNDGLNDKWRVSAQGPLNSFSIAVYNRWGTQVYFSTDINTYWDGLLKGVSVPYGTFVYIINAKDYNNKTIKQKGFVSIVR